MDQRRNLLFPLSEQKKANRGETKVILEIFRKTLSELPYGDQEQAAKQIFDILYKSNKIQFKTDERQTLLQEIEHPAAQILDGLRAKLKDVAAPIGRNEERIAKLLVGTHYEFALAYRCMLDNSVGKGLTRSGDKVANADRIRHAIHHLGEILRTKYSVSSTPGGTIWKYIYTLFIHAHNHGIHEISLPPSAWCKFNTVDDAFKSILLLSLSSPLTMRGNDLNDFYNLAPELIKYIELGKIQCGEDYPDLMTFNLSGTEPPKKQFATGCDSCGNAANCFAVSTAQLVDYIEKQQAQAKNKHQLTPVQKFLASHNHMDSLKHKIACSERAGNEKRVKGDGLQVELVAGFSDAYTYLNKGAEYNGEEICPAPESDSWETIGEESITVEDTADWTTTGIIRAGLRKTTCNVTNHSSGGYCLYIDATEKFHLRVGELAIVKESGKDLWRMAVIIWVSGGKKRMGFGVKLLDGKISTGTFRPVYSKSADQRLDCMLLTSNNGNGKGSSRVVTASSDFYPGDMLAVWHNGEEHQITVTRINSQSNGYAEYICDWSAPAVTTTVDQRAKPAEKPFSEMDFESIWDEL